MIFPIPLPFLDYHPLMQPVTDRVRRKLRTSLSLFWVIVAIQLLSSLFYVLSSGMPPRNPEFVVAPVVPLFAIYAGRTLIPMQFFVLICMSLPLDIITGYHFLRKCQHATFDVNPVTYYGHQPKLSAHTDRPKLLNETEGPKFLRPVDDASHRAYAEEILPLSGRRGELVSPNRRFPRLQSNWQQEYARDNNVDFSDVEHEVQKYAQTWSRQSRNMTSFRWHHLVLWDKLNLVNLLLFSLSGFLLSASAWFLYQKLCDAASEEFREPLRRLSVSSTTYGTLTRQEEIARNVLCSQPPPGLQEPPPVLPFTGQAIRVGSEELISTH